MKGKRRNINRLTVSRSLEGSYRSFYEKCENPRHITVHTSETNNVDRIQIILFLISFSFYFKKLLLLRIYWVRRTKLMRTPHRASLFRASARLLPSFACLHLSSLRDGIISDIRSSVGRDSISPATRLRDGDRSSYWHTNNHAAPELGRSVELLNFDITHYSEGDACLLYLGTK